WRRRSYLLGRESDLSRERNGLLIGGCFCYAGYETSLAMLVCCLPAPGGPSGNLSRRKLLRIAGLPPYRLAAPSIIPCRCAAACSMSSYLYCPARLSAASTPQR